MTETTPTPPENGPDGPQGGPAAPSGQSGASEPQSEAQAVAESVDAPYGGPGVAECAQADRRWPLQKAGE